MANCLSSPTSSPSKLHSSHHSVYIDPPLQQPPLYGISYSKQNKIIKWVHAPLKNSQFLFNKFHHDSHRPDELNLQWQLLDLKVKQQRKELQIYVVNKVGVRVWVILGGKQRKTLTGLYVDVQQIQFCQMLQIDTICTNLEPQIFTIKFDRISKIDSESKMLVILQSKSDPQQSLSLIHIYSLAAPSPKLLKQQLMWNNLAFQIQTIFNQNQSSLNVNNQSQTLCVICNESVSVCIMVPCKHMCICRGCLNSFKKNFSTCPLCKIQYSDIVIYKDVKL